MEERKLKVLILGATGMLGHVLYRYLSEKNSYDLYNLSFRKPLNEQSIVCDITNEQEVQQVLTSLQPNIIVNCIGVLIKGSQSDPANAIFINSYFPHFLSRNAEKINAKLIHISTDCVFSGTRGGYTEADFRDADDIYGRSKSLGELMNHRDLTLRTSIIGPEIKENGEGLLHWFLNQTGTVNGYTEALWGGVTTLELSKVIEAAISQELTGLINITNGSSISKFELLQLFKKVFQREHVEVNPFEGKKVDKSLLSIRTDLNYAVPSYETMIQEMRNNMVANRETYEQIYTDIA